MSQLTQGATRWLSKLSQGATLWIGVLVILSYWVFAPRMRFEQLMEWMRSSQILVSLAVVLIYLPSFREIFVARMPSTAQQLVLGIIVGWAGAAGNASWFLLWRLAGKPEWMTNSHVNGFTIWMMVIGAFLHLTAPRSIKGEFPRTSWVWISVVFVASTALAVYMITAPPDARGLAEWLRPYLS